MNSRSYSIARLKDGLSAIIADVAAGGEVVVTDHNRPVARIVPLSRLPRLPKADAAEVLTGTPVAYRRRPKTSAAALVRRLRDD